MIQEILLGIFQKHASANCWLLRVASREPGLRENASAHAVAHAKGKELPSNSHIVRYVKPSMIREDGSVVAMEFCLRPNRPDEKGISVNRLEAFGGSKKVQLSKVRRLFRLTIRRTGRFAEINVGELRKNVVPMLKTIRVVHDPLDAEGGFEPDPSHAEITGLPKGNTPEAMQIGSIISQCVQNMHPATDLSVVN